MTLPAALQPLADDASRAALLLDFDGSIAPIVDDPADATPLPAMVDALRALQPVLARVAVVSGRAVDFLAAALPADVALVGLYGLERRVDGITTVDPRAEPWIAPIAAAADAAEVALPGLLVERKGNLCVTIHFRTAPERGDDARAVAHDLARRYGIDAPQRGRMAVELRPPVPVDKGTVVEELAAGMTVAAFAGDDAGDLPAFAALVDLVRVGALTHGVRIGVASAEAPAAILSADVVVDGPPALAELLDALTLAIRSRA